MAFSESIKDAAYKRSGGRCECTRKHPGVSSHSGQCTTKFSRNGSWHAHHKTAVASGGADTLSNCEVLCLSCHKLTQTYGG